MKRYPLGNYGLSIVLSICFLVSIVLQTWAGWVEFGAEQKEHGSMAQVWGADGYFPVWARTVFENWQSEFLQVLAFVVFTTYFIHKGSHESKDTDDKQEEQLDRIEAMLKTLQEERSLSAKSSEPTHTLR
ncbi:hypothetical protein EON82_15635 [bacterium]|nr:MAG: hypothetical protein EON82_15635 [bacterium]